MDLCLVSAGETLKAADSAASRLIPGSCTGIRSSSSRVRHFPGLGFPVGPLNLFHRPKQQGMQRKKLLIWDLQAQFENPGQDLLICWWIFVWDFQTFCGVCRSSSLLGVHGRVQTGIREPIFGFLIKTDFEMFWGFIDGLSTFPDHEAPKSRSGIHAGLPQTN